HERDFATSLVNTVPMIVLLMDMNGYIKYINPYFEQFSGYTLNEVKGREWFATFLPERDQDRIRELFHDAVNELEIRGNINSIIKHDGEEREIEWFSQLMRDVDGAVTGLLSIGQDVTERRQMEAELYKASRFNEKIINELPIGLSIYDHTGQCIRANESIAKMVGATLEQVLAQNYKNIASWKKSGLLDVASKCIRLQQKQRHEFDLLTTFGRHALYDCLFVPFKLHDEQHLLLMLDDITERKKAERAFQLQAKIIDQIHDSVISTDLDGFISSWNKGSEKLLGYASEEILGKHLTSIYPEEEHAFLKNEVIATLKKNGEYDAEVRMRRKSGEVFFAHVSLTMLYDEQGNVNGMIGYAMDITKRTQAERALEFAQRQAHLGSWDWDLVNDVVLWSDETYRIFGVEDKTRHIPLNIAAVTEMVVPEDRPVLQQAIENTLSNKIEDYSVEFHLIRPGGEIRFVEAHGTASYYSDGTPARLTGSVQDITERKAVERKLEEYRSDLERLVADRTTELEKTHEELVRKERLATLGQLTATVSHELRNPLGAMKPSLYIIEKKSDKNDERLQQAIARVDRNINRCDRIIDELLDFTRITDLERHLVRIDEWLESVINEQTIKKGIRVEKDLSLKDIELLVDSDRLRRAVINVVENACHAMLDDNQKVTKNACLNIKTQASDERVEIIITDTGSGIAENILEKIFEPLFSTKGFGVGLGMPTVKQIMEQHGGGVEIESEPDKGSVVTLWLPNIVK
ncbi:MAG: PAS domain S-box protein, partial [Gammaproteobacteria bacterium]|nr:PAS domain S-box protein [Gammaproteobacteria bacterium]